MDLHLLRRAAFGNSITPMRRLAFVLLLACTVAATGCREKPATPPAPKPVAAPAGPVFRLHFAGLNHIATNGSSAKLNTLLSTPEAVAARKQVHDRLSLSLASWLYYTNSAAYTNRTALLRPLLDDLATNEFVFELHTLERAEWTLGVALNQSQLDTWTKNLSESAALTRSVLPLTNDVFPSWVVLCDGPSAMFRFVRANDWMLVTTSLADSLKNLITSIKSTGRPVPRSTNILDLTADLARLQPALDLPKAVAWPHLSVSVTAKGDALRSEATLKFANAAPWKLDSFRLPTNSVRDPLISFTAIQGFGDWLARLPEFKEWELKSTPNQFFTWARSDVPYNLLAAAPMPDASNTVVRAAPHALHTLGTNIAKAGIGRIAFTTNRTEIGWVGMPILVPFVRPAPEAGNDFLLFGSMAGIIPTGPNTNPPPAELLSQFLPRTNLVYYDWEITEAKLAQWVPIFQLTAMLSPNPSFPGAAAANQWLRAVSPKLGNTISEVTAVSPTELKAVRRSDLGLTAIELTWLARWLDNPAFPAFTYPTNSLPGLPPTPGGVPKLPGK